MKSMVGGYKLNNYNATYEPRNFFFEELVEGDTRTIKVSDPVSGEEMWFRAPLRVETPGKNPKRNPFMA